jgi:hypothetical protein
MEEVDTGWNGTKIPEAKRHPLEKEPAWGLVGNNSSQAN